jgi:acetyltransferase-like isoleucine patch superfamily enzyme
MNALITKKIKNFFQFILKHVYPTLYRLEKNFTHFEKIQSKFASSVISEKSRIQGPAQITHSEIGDYTYIAMNSSILSTKIGKFCSIGPNLLCGWGIHPTNGLSTSPVFYSTNNQAGTTFSKENKVVETLPIEIGSDVFIGMNVTILDGIKIGHGAVIGAGAIVSKNIPPYAIAVGAPIQIVRFRFRSEIIDKLLYIKWWDFEEKELKNVEKYFFDIEEFVAKYAPN